MIVTARNTSKMNFELVDNIYVKSRAILLDSKNDIVVVKYADLLMLPGGKVDVDESGDKALVRELKEELGIEVNSFDLYPFVEISTYIEDYPIVDSDRKENRYNITTYFLLETDLKFDKENVNLSEREKKGNFEVLTMNVEELYKLVKNYHSSNERYCYFRDELLIALDWLKDYISKQNKVKYNKLINSYKESEKNIDMHVHSLYSDGELSPDELVNLAFDYNIGTMAITDHDTVQGIKNLNRNSFLIVDSGINIIDGIELSARVDKGIMHILGYGIDKDNELLNKRLNEIKSINVNSVLSIIEMLKKDYNIYFTYDELRDLINSNHNLGRPDIAKLLIKNGYVRTMQEAFDRYLIGIKAKLGDRVKGIPYEECIDLIIKSGGIPVLAHPKTLKLNDKELRELISYMKGIGLNGIEIFHSIHNDEDRENYLNIANEYDLLISGGTDYHGPINKPNIKLGSGENNNIKIKKLTLVDELNKR